MGFKVNDFLTGCALVLVAGVTSVPTGAQESARPARNFGVLSELAGSAWSIDGGVQMRFRWEIPGEILVEETTDQDGKVSRSEYRLSLAGNSINRLEGGISSPVILISSTSWSAPRQSGERVGCRVTADAQSLMCERSLGNKTSYFHYRKISISRYPSSPATAVGPTQGLAVIATEPTTVDPANEQLRQKWGIFADICKVPSVDGHGCKINYYRSTAESGNGRNWFHAVMALYWSKDEKGEIILRENKTYSDFGGKTFNEWGNHCWRLNGQGSLIWVWGCLSEKYPFTIDSQGNLTGKYDGHSNVSIQRFGDGFALRQFNKDGSVKWQEIWTPTSAREYATRSAEVEAAHNAPKSSGPGFFGTLASAAMTAVEVATVSSYTGGTNPNLYRGAAVDENSAQNQQFRANIARITGTGNGARGGNAPNSASGSGTGAFVTQPDAGSVRQPPAAGIAQTSPATAVNSVRYFACSSVRRKILPDNSLAIASMSYGVVTSSRDSSDVATRFGQQTHTTGRIDGENGGSDCFGYDTPEEAQSAVNQLVNRDRRGTFEVITGVDFSW